MTKKLLFITILLSPTYIVRRKICCLPAVGVYPTTLLEILILVTFGIYLAEKIRKKNFHFSPPGFQFLIAIGFFLAAAGISIWVSPDKIGALGIFRAYFLEPLLIFSIITDVIRERRDALFLLYALFLSGFWIALLAIIQALTGRWVFAPHEMAQGRAHAVYNTANAVGLYLGPIFAISLGLFLDVLQEKLKARSAKPCLAGRQVKTAVRSLKLLVFFTLSILYVVAIIFTKSRGALLGVLVVASLLTVAFSVSVSPNLFISKMIRRSIRMIFIFCLLSILTLGFWFFYNISDFTPRVENIYERSGGSGLVRLCLWEGTRNLLRDKPVFGAGLSGFKEVYSQNYVTCDAEPLEYPHNWVLNFWTETGLLGLLSFVLLLLIYFRGLMFKGSFLSLVFVIAMAYWLFHGLVDVPYFKNDLALEFWVIVALARLIP